MKKLFSFILALAILAPLSSFAFKADAGENLNLTSPIQGDYYVAWGNVNLNATTNGDLVIAGGKIIINGDINDDLLIAWGEIFINGNIWESARIMGGEIILESTIQKDLLLAGGEISIKEKTNIEWETKIVGGKIDFAGTANNAEFIAEEIILQWTIKGNAILKAERIKVKTGAKIIGNLYYETPNQNTELEGIVSGQVTFKQEYFSNKKEILGIFSSFAWARLAFLVIFGLILFFAAHQYIKPSLETLNKEPRESLGVGFLVYAALPFIAILLAITIIWIPFSLLALMIFITLMMFAKLLNVYFYTNFLIQRRGGHNKLNNWKKVWILLGCAILSAILSGIDMIFSFFALGAIIRTHIIKKK
jgi:hypothetical protein